MVIWVLLLLLNVTACATSPARRQKREIRTGTNSANIQPNTYFGPACFGIYNYKQTGYTDYKREILPFLGNKEMIQYPGASALSGTVNANAMSSTVTLTVTALSYKGNPLYGWFHLRLQSTSSVPLTWVFAQGESELTESANVGSFVYLPSAMWDSSCKQGAFAKRDIVPCYYSQEPFPLSPYSFGRYAPSGAGNSLSLFFKIDFPLCDVLNSQNGIYFRIYTLAGSPVQLRIPSHSLTYLQDYVYGAPDPAPPAFPNSPTDVTCNTALSSATSYGVNTTKGSFSITAQQVIPWDTCIDNIAIFGNDYEGRCNVNTSKYTKEETLWWDHPPWAYYCFSNQNSSRDESNWPNLKDYIIYVENFTTTCPNCTASTIFLQTVGITVKTDVGKYIWAARQAHSFFMILSCMVIYPIMAYLARYYKETFMSLRPLHVHVWYYIHTYGGILLSLFLINGLTVGVYGRKFYGYSLSTAGKAHVIGGYVAYLAALAGALSSGVRLRESHLRSLVIGGHFLTGLIFYVFSLISILTSMFVPGSPSAGEELPSGWDKPGATSTGIASLETSFPYMIVVLVLWLGFEAVMQWLSMVRFLESDRRARRRVFPRRKWVLFAVPIPLSWPEETRDFVGADQRKFLLKLYILGAFVISAIFILWISFAPLGNRSFGLMRYTHGGKFQDLLDALEDSVDNTALNV